MHSVATAEICGFSVNLISQRLSGSGGRNNQTGEENLIERVVERSSMKKKSTIELKEVIS